MTEAGLTNEYEEGRQHLGQILNEVEGLIAPGVGSDLARAMYKELVRDLRSDFFTVVVLGEFKRGKSTLVNALVGQRLLPADVTPTTATINAIRFGDPSITVHRPNGVEEPIPFGENGLRRFVADADFDPATVSYIDITLPSPLLQNRVVLVDTPGVDDLNQQRVEITHRFLPRADAAIFLLDATSPVKLTEKLFLEEHLAKGGIEQVLFVANFADQVDLEESPDLEQVIRNRLAAATGHQEHAVYLVSASQALEGRLAKNEDLLGQSGLPALEAALEGMLAQGARGRSKLNRLRHRTRTLLSQLETEVERSIAMSQASADELQRALAALQAEQAKKAARSRAVADYVRDRQMEIVTMARKSLQFFADRLREQIMGAFDEYKSPDFKAFVETKIPQQIRRALRGWAETYSDAIETLLHRMEQELAAGLSQEFQVAVLHLGTTRTGGMDESGELRVKAQDVSNVMMQAGLIAGGLGVAAVLLAGPLMPLVGMVAYPFLQKTMLEQQLTKAKAEARIQVSSGLDEILHQFEEGVVGTINANVARIHETALGRFQELLAAFEQQLRAEMAVREEGSQKQRRGIQELEAIRSQIQRLLAGFGPAGEGGMSA
jgi:GTPase SAR1 family protein